MPEKDVETGKIAPSHLADHVRFEVYGQEMIDKQVRASGNSGRVYLPASWVGHQVKILRID